MFAKYKKSILVITAYLIFILILAVMLSFFGLNLWKIADTITFVNVGIMILLALLR